MRSLLREPWAVALLIAALSMATVGGAWAFQFAGYTPCELCLKERIPYYVAALLGLATAAGARRGFRAAALAGFLALILCFMAGTALGLYHTGVEMKLWAGPSECSGAVIAPPDVGDFLKQLDTVNVTRCDEAALHVFGLSLALWNALICIGLIGLSNVGLLRAARIARPRSPGGLATAP